MNTAVTRNDWVGRVIDGRFPLLEWLGSSEKAGVFRTELAEPQAGRAIIRLLTADGENAEDCLSAWASAAKLSHPHLMRIFRYGRAQVGGVDVLYIVTEFAEESLEQVIPERPLSTGEARAMLVPILDALSYLHAQGLVHGRIKPSNVTVVGDLIKLPVESIRPAGRCARAPEGLERYDAPEVASGTISPAADIWSVGITLVEALTQNPPQWDRSTNRDPVVPAEIPLPFASIARACLRYDPAYRFGLGEINDLLSGRPFVEEASRKIDQGAPAEAARIGRTIRRDARPTNAIGIMAAIFVVIIGLIAFLVIRAHRFQVPAAPATERPAEQSQAPAVPPPPPAAPSTQQPAQQTPTPTPATPAPPPASPPVSQSAADGGATAKGEVKQRVTPDVSANANHTIQGKVEVRVRLNVDANGAVSEAAFDTPGPSRYFSAKALDAARKWQFKPAQENGRAVPSVWTLRFDFRRDGPEITAQQVSP